MATRRLTGLLLAAVAMAAGGGMPFPAHAHHSHAMFDVTKEITVTGTVGGVSYTNPHVYLFIEAKNAGGEAEKWAVEMSHVGNMIDRGVLRDTIKVGDQIVIMMNPAREGKKGGNYTHIVSINGVMNTAEGGNWAAAKPAP
jgi:hypothetical protein